MASNEIIIKIKKIDDLHYQLLAPGNKVTHIDLTNVALWLCCVMKPMSFDLWNNAHY